MGVEMRFRAPSPLPCSGTCLRRGAQLPISYGIWGITIFDGGGIF